MHVSPSKKLIVPALLMMSLSGFAQTHEFGFSAGGGIGGLRYEVNGQDSKLKPTANFGLSYTLLCKAGWGLHTGLQLGFMETASAAAAKDLYVTNTVDSEDEAIEFRVRQKGYSEKQKIYTLNIPLMVQWQAPQNTRTKFFVRGGAKLLLPVKSTFTATADEISSTGFYPAYNAELANLPQFGFGTKSQYTAEGDFDLKPTIALAAEAGAKFSICKSRFLYAGAYLDYGLNDIKKESKANSLLEYNPTSFASSKPNSLLSLPDVNRIRMISYGIRLQYAFGISR